MAKVLVTGGAGYLGSVLVGHLLRRGYQVTVVDSLIYGGNSLLPYCSHPHFDFVTNGDVRDGRLMKELTKKHDAILPLAALVGVKLCAQNPETAQEVNYRSIVLLNQLRSPDQKVIWPCTNIGYGTKSGELYCTEETPMEPESVYGVTKVNAEQELFNSPNTISLRLATVFGPSPRMRRDLLVNDFVYRAVTEGSLVIYEKDFKRNYVHVEDVAECFCFCLENFETMKGEAYNVGLKDVLSKAELAQKIKEYVPRLQIQYAEVDSDPDKRNYIVSTEKINRKGFTAKRSLDQGIQELIKAYRLLRHSEESWCR